MGHRPSDLCEDWGPRKGGGRPRILPKTVTLPPSAVTVVTTLMPRIQSRWEGNLAALLALRVAMPYEFGVGVVVSLNFLIGNA